MAASADRFRSLLSEARRRRERRLLLVEGGVDAVRSAAGALADRLSPASGCWIGDVAWPSEGADQCGEAGKASLPRLDHSRAAALLGDELDLLIYDAFCGLDPDALGAAVGTLRAGGLLVLLIPRLDRWPGWPDPVAVRLGAAPESGVQSRYIARLSRLLASADGVLRLSADGLRAALGDDVVLLGPAPVSIGSQGIDAAAPAPLTADQQQAVDAIRRTARGRAGRPLVLIADRGRGKSSALGLAAGGLIAEDDMTVLVTAPRFAATAALFAQARGLLPVGSEERLRFLAPDDLLQERPAADLLLIDESAGIPAPMLEAMLHQYRRVCLATTVHGYEGTGRGFEVRFRGLLNRQWPGWRRLRLEAPIRWADTDPLEVLVDRALLLDAEPVDDAAVAAGLSADTDLLRIDRDRLVDDEPWLRSLFGLLVLGHYQTRPSDLRLLLDGRDLALFAQIQDGLTLATALVSLEGGLDAELVDAVFAGRRRPRGHLLPQTLSAHAGLLDAPRLRYARIVRIAVHPAARRRGLGRTLVQGIAEHYARVGLDCVGASFGAEHGLLRFWRHCGLAAVHLGSRRNAASGAHAAVVLKGLSAAGSRLEAQAGERLAARLPLLLAGPFRRLDPRLAAALLSQLPAIPTPPPDAGELRELHGFAHASRPLEASLAPLHRLVVCRLGPAMAADRLRPAQTAALIATVLQLRSIDAVTALIGCSGRRELIARLRGAAACLLGVGDAVDDRPAPDA